MRIVLTGGGSGGHLTPLEPIVDALRAQFQTHRVQLPVWIDSSKLELYFLGVLDAESRALFQRLGVTAIHIPAGKVRRYASALTLGDLFLRLPHGVVKALVQMWSIMPDVVISKGGYGSIPTCLAATFYRVPFLLHESDAALGLANRRLAPLASVITVGFAATRHSIQYYKNKTIVTGTPVREALFREEQAAAKRHFGFSPDEPVLLVMGGSQGAAQLNDVLLESLPTLLPEVSIIHLTGTTHTDAVRRDAAERISRTAKPHAYRAFGYLTSSIGQAITAADAVVTRAGATALAEVAYAGKAAVVVPLASAAQDHQKQNAAVFDAAQAAIVLAPENLGKALFVQSVRSALFDTAVREALQTNISQLAHRGAARDIASLVFKLAHGLAPVQPGEEKENSDERGTTTTPPSSRKQQA